MATDVFLNLFLLLFLLILIIRYVTGTIDLMVTCYFTAITVLI